VIALLLALAQDPVRVPDGWTVETVLEAPRLLHPTVVAPAPDGTVYVAEDPMDMEGPVDARLGRVLRIAPDGGVSVFLEKLGPVFGLAWHEGRLYVHDCLSLNAWRDRDGRAVDPVQVLPATHPDP
jgi:sugar lactone lactonase YvrE